MFFLVRLQEIAHLINSRKQVFRLAKEDLGKDMQQKRKKCCMCALFHTMRKRDGCSRVLALNPISA
jgi:hypothetical protein